MNSLIFTRLERLLTISDQDLLLKRNQEPPLTSYLSFKSIITNNHTELQAPRGRRFCLPCWSTFLGTDTPNASGFSGVQPVCNDNIKRTKQFLLFQDGLKMKKEEL